MTNQEVFDFGYTAIYNQGDASVDSEKKCFYRHPDGIRRCVAGYFIPDSKYVPEMETLVVFPDMDFVTDEKQLIVREFFESEGFDLRLMNAMQDAHDDAAVASNFLIVWKERMRRVASQFGLSAEVIKD